MGGRWRLSHAILQDTSYFCNDHPGHMLRSIYSRTFVGCSWNVIHRHNDFRLQDYCCHRRQNTTNSHACSLQSVRLVCFYKGLILHIQHFYHKESYLFLLRCQLLWEQTGELFYFPSFCRLLLTGLKAIEKWTNNKQANTKASSAII